MQYTETELAKLIETVEKTFTDHLNKAEEAHKATLSKSEAAPLAKAEDSKPSEKKDEKKDEKPSESKEAAPEKSADANPAEAKPEAKEGEQPAAAPAQAAPAPSADGSDHCDYDNEDLEHMHKMYASMSKGELKAHHDSIRKALDAHSAAPAAPAAPAQAAPAPISKSEIKDENPVLNSKATDKGSDTNTEYNKNSGGDISKTGEPSGSPGAKSPASKAEGVQMDKSEKTEVDLLKSELETEKSKSADLKKNFDAVSEFLTKFVGKIQAPKGKAITEIAAIQKSEGATGEDASLSKSEITQVLMKKAQDPSLSKADRDAINAFYLNNTNVNTISHLLKN